MLVSLTVLPERLLLSCVYDFERLPSRIFAVLPYSRVERPHPFIYTIVNLRRLPLVTNSDSRSTMRYFSPYYTAAFLLIASTLTPSVLSHNYVECTNAKPNLTALLTETLAAYDSSQDECDGYPRGTPDANAFQGSQTSITGQSFPW